MKWTETVGLQANVGVYKSANGERYEGGMKKGKREGKGSAK